MFFFSFLLQKQERKYKTACGSKVISESRIHLASHSPPFDYFLETECRPNMTHWNLNPKQTNSWLIFNTTVHKNTNDKSGDTHKSDIPNFHLQHQWNHSLQVYLFYSKLCLNNKFGQWQNPMLYSHGKFLKLWMSPKTATRIFF